jgi:lactate dehydrogenase-like 2-hydroxyacid dehydrogenase
MKVYSILLTSPDIGHENQQEILDLWKKYHCDILVNTNGPMTEDMLLNHEKIEVIDGILVYSSSDQITAKVIEKARNLKVISRHGVGIENIDIQEANHRNIKVTRTIHTHGEKSVADFAFAMILSLARNICDINCQTKQHHWYRALSTDVWGKTLGIIGLGKIGKEVAKRAKGFDMKIIAYDPLPNKVFANQYDIQYVSLDNLLQVSDFLTIHCNLTDCSRNLIDFHAFELMKKTAYLINAARGPIVNEKALYMALKDKKIAGAAIDVYNHEPPFQSSILFKEPLDNLITTSHTALYTKDIIKRMDREAVINIIENLK